MMSRVVKIDLSQQTEGNQILGGVLAIEINYKPVQTVSDGIIYLLPDNNRIAGIIFTIERLV